MLFSIILVLYNECFFLINIYCFRGGILFISVSDLLKIDRPNIIDIRSREKFNDNHIPGALNINGTFLLNTPEKYLNRRDVYYIYCQYGVSSKTVVKMLRMRGYNVVSVIGGYEAWILK